MSKKLLSIMAVSMSLLVASSAQAIIGIGVHWGNDFTLSMKDKTGEQLSFDKLKINISSIGGTAPTGLTSITGNNLPIYIDRSDWTRSYFNLGGKIFIDILPVIDAIEISSNYGIWEYMGQIRYPKSLTFKSNASASDIGHPDQLFTPVYDSLPITLKEYNMEFLGLSKTPYMKLDFDLTIRKYLVRIPPKLNWFRIHAGAGASLQFATPMLSKGLVEDALGELLNSSKDVSAIGADLFGNQNDLQKEVSKKIIKQITSNMMTPHWGCHIDLGVMLKIPVMPLGFYVDGKYMIPFGDMDKAVDIGGFGFVLNSGVCLTI